MYKELTPAMRQYLDIKGLHKDAIVFFRMGDFYEMFFDDAVLASGILEIALTSRDREKKIPMCGVPYHAASSYIARLIKAGHKVAVCEQMDAPPGPGHIVERAVTRVITPGIAFEDELLDRGSNNFISSVFAASGKYGLASMDVSTGEFMATELATNAELRDEISRLRPIELALPEGQAIPAGGADWPVRKITRLPSLDFSMHRASERLLSHFNAASLDGFGLVGLDAAIPAAGALLNYIKETQKSPLGHVRKCSPYFSRDYMHIDDASRRNLEIVRNMPAGAAEGTLLGLLDRTKTAMGARLLKSFLLRPLKDALAINRRLDAVAEITGDRASRKRLATFMGMVYDLERLAGRLSAGLSSPRDLAMLKSSLEIVPEIKSILTMFVSPVLSEAAACLDPVHEAVDMIREAIVDSPPVSIKDGGVIRNGYSSTLDELRRVGSGGKDWLARLEASERSRTGISSLKVGYNRVFGYYIAVTKANLRDIPEDYIRKQTLVNAERYITAELKEWEEKILTAGEKA
ncbi:MAG: DNA mismatch repair protein MutS, partial [Deltaproteobacteria bacterium]|nr:DNA mismatch repair protein MutS [Deltaproteobacteria bacterium]